MGIYVDGPNMERGLFEAGELKILERVGSVLMEHAQSLGEVVDADVFLDEATLWRSQKTREDYELNGFRFRETKSFKHMDLNTGAISFGKSLTDPSMHCAIVDRLHDQDCPDILVLVTGDKDITVVLEYISMHHKEAVVVGEANSISSSLPSADLGCRVRSDGPTQQGAGRPCGQGHQGGEAQRAARVTDRAGKR